MDLTPNRADCLSLRGIAREVGVMNQSPLTEAAISKVAPAIDDALTVTLADNAGCPRYLGRVIKGVDVNAATPLWMVERLRRAGLRTIDPIVDVTNYVLVELGQPLHAFDLARLSGGITVRKAKTDETLTTLDDQELTLRDDTLVIADDSAALALAGVMGGKPSSVTTDTQDIFLECAFFAPLAIAGKARSYGLHTDSSHRFERGVDPQLQSDAIEYATALIQQIAGGQAGPVTEAVDEAQLPKQAELTLRAYGFAPRLIADVGVAGLHRLLARLDDVTSADAVICIAGMEGALASVIGGLTAVPVVAVPTSVGYGAGLEGVTALLAMHASCASGISVVGIDNGFGAACAIARMCS